MNAKQLKDSILQHAFQGKLVPQNPNDEKAQQLIEEIMEEKARLIKAKIIKKEKPLPPIIEEEIPFDIPSSWEWVRIRDIYYNSGQKKPESDFCYIDVACIDNQKGEITREYQILNSDNAPSRARKIVNYGEVIYSTVRPYLQNIAVIDRTFEYETIASTAFIVMCPIKIYNKFLFYVLKSPYFNALVESKMQGATYPAINDANFNNLIIPIPPLNEQFRIVEKIENLFDKVEDYDIAYTNVETLKTQFPFKLENSILQYAIQGKLVEQNPSDEPAQLLVEKLKLEKEQLIKAKVIKKEKPCSEILKEEIPFDIPSSWEWVRLGDIAKIISGYSFKSGDFVKAGEINVVKITNVGVGEFLEDSSSLLPLQFKEEYKDFLLCTNDILIALTRPFIKNGLKVCIYNETNREALLNQRVACIRNIYKGVLNDYLYIYLRSPMVLDYVKESSKTTNQPNLSINSLKELMIPLPSYKEQKRIVEAVEKMMIVKNKLNY